MPRPAGWPRWAGAWHNALVAHVGPWPQAVVPDEIKGHQTYMNLTGAFFRTKVYCLSTGLRNTASFSSLLGHSGCLREETSPKRSGRAAAGEPRNSSAVPHPWGSSFATNPAITDATGGVFLLQHRAEHEIGLAVSFSGPRALDLTQPSKGAGSPATMGRSEWRGFFLWVLLP